MAQSLFDVSGISLDGNVDILYGLLPPGSTTETNNAPKGSVYFATDGITWKKTEIGSGTGRWIRSPNGDLVSGINSYNSVIDLTVVDSLLASEVNTGVWAVTVANASDLTSHQTIIITGSHNNSETRFSTYNKISFGTKIQGVSYNVRLANGNFELTVNSTTTTINIDCYRLNAVSTSSSITLGGAGANTALTNQLDAEIQARIDGDSALAATMTANLNATTLQFVNVNSAISTLNAKVEPWSFHATIYGIPISNQVVGLALAAKSGTLTGGFAKALTPSSANSVFTLFVNDVQKETVTFTASNPSGSLIGDPINYQAGDIIKLMAPATVDNLLSDISFVFIGV